MELNAKTAIMWDMENLVKFNTNVGEAPKTLQLVNSEIKGIEGFEASSFYSSGGHSDNSSWRSSKSASGDSSTNKEIKQARFSFESNECFQDRLKTKETVESSCESLTTLELCNRTYFDDVSGFSNVKDAAPTRDSSVKKSKSSSLGLETPRCQVEGCNVDLSAAKSYHRKHRVCDSHSKCSRVVVSGHERRFCQQCSRFHGLSEFDQKKRSCRNRLSHHNARRRKPKPEVIQVRSMRLASPLSEGRNQLKFVSNQVPAHSNTWDDNTRGFMVPLPETDVFTYKVYPVSDQFLPSNGTPHDVYPRGVPTSVTASNMEATQNQGALSLLSIGSWGSFDPAEPSPHIHGALPHGGFSTSSGFWVAAPGVGSHADKPSFQLFKAPDESGFYFY